VLHDGLFAGSAGLPAVVIPTRAWCWPTLAASSPPGNGGDERRARARLPRLARGARRPLREYRLAAGAAGRRDQADLGQVPRCSRRRRRSRAARWPARIGRASRLPDDPRGVSIELPVWIVPGQADENGRRRSLGYGRRARRAAIANGVGVECLSACARRATGSTSPVAPRLEPTQWAMAIDLNACIGCNACVVACQAENNVPVVGARAGAQGPRDALAARRPLLRGRRRRSPAVASSRCPACTARTPRASRSARSPPPCTTPKGLNVMVYNRCIGTRYCSNNCPYKVRRFNYFNYTKDTPELAGAWRQPRRHGALARRHGEVHLLHAAHHRGQASKPSWPAGRSSTATSRPPASRPARRRRSSSATSCSRRAPRERKGEPRNYVLLGELANRPRTSYLAKIRNPNPHYEWA
jgi:Fe-S-cluster-containing dehydrogenase component